MELKNMRHELFCHAYIKHMVVAHAYREVYPKSKNPDKDGYKLMIREDIKARIGELKEEVYKEKVADTLEVLSTLTEVARGESQHESWSVSNQLKALELLGKYHVLFTEKVEQTNKEEVVVELLVVDDED